MIRTPHFKFPYFQDGELFSSTLDEERAMAFDLLMKAMSEVVEDGIIDGWDITEVSGLNINVSAGKGFISGFYGVTQNNTVKTLSDDSTNYIFATRNSNITDSISASSNKVEVSFVDSDSPSAPSSLQVDSVGERTITLLWTKNSDSDIDYYKVYRKLSVDMSYTFVVDVDHLSNDGNSDVTYQDTSLEPDTEYDYQVSAVDLSGNESGFSLVSGETDLDVTPASEVTNIRVAVANESVSFTWNPSTSDDLDSYIVTLSELTSQGVVTNTITVNVAQNLYYFNNSLKNNVGYRAIIKTLDDFGNISDGIVKDFTPRTINAPEEVGSFGYTVSNVRSPEPVTPQLVFSWTASASTDVSHYNLYIYDEGVRSETILVGNNLSKTMISYPARDGQVIVSKIFEDSKNYEVKLTVVDSNSNESEGIFIKIVIPDYSPPSEVKNIQSEVGDAYVSISWDAVDEKDFSNYSLNYWDTATESTFSETISYASFSGSTFTLSNPVVGTYPVGSWIELTSSPSSGGQSVKLLLVSAANPSDMTLVCDYIPTYYDQTSSIKITNPPTAVTFSQREYYRVTGLTNSLTYKFILRTVDEDANISDGIIVTATPVASVFDIESPLVVSAKGKDSEIKLSWSRSENIEGYKVYRAGPLDIYTSEALLSDFSLLATVVGQNITDIYDIGLTNDYRYSYIVTSYLGATESTFELEDQVIEKPVDMLNSEPPENLAAIISSGQVDLSWDPPSDITGIEGWNIYRGSQKYGSYELIGSVPFTTLAYTDDGLINGETYFYIVRSFSNTVDINTSISSTVPSLSILIGQVVTQLGSIASITPERTIIANLENAIQTITESFLINHKHSAEVEEEFSETRNEALKINLSAEDDITVFETNDYQNYVSQRDLEDIASYVVYINDQVPNLLYEVDFDSNSIVFETALYSEAGGSPYSEPPIVRLQFINLKEISGQLHSRFIDDLSAMQIVSGILPKTILPQISHSGRIKEMASVRSYLLLGNDNIYYDLNNITYVVNDENVKIEFGTPTVFYDFFESNSNLYGASNKGILKSEDGGIIWDALVVPDDLIRKFYAKQINDDIIYFGIGRRKVYSTKDGENWFAMRGLEAVGIIHDLAEDASGNIYLATDTGVYVYNIEFASRYTFSSAAIIEFESTTSEIISLISLGGSDILATTSDGVFCTSNLGVTWSQYSSVGPLYNLRRFNSTRILSVNEEGYINYTDDDGINWSTMDDFSIIDRDDVFEMVSGRLFFTTTEGVFYTDNLSDVYEINGEFKRKITKSQVRGFYGTSKTNVIIAFDNKVYKWKDGKITLWSEFIGVIPSVFVDDVLLVNGYYYNVVKNDLYFEWKRTYDEVATIATSYDEYLLPGGGWQDIDSSDVNISAYVNKNYLGSINSSDLEEDYIDRNDETEEILNKRYEFAYEDQRKLIVYSVDGKVYITGPDLTKFDEIQISIENVTFTDEGSNTHNEIDDALSKRDVGLPFGLGNSYLDNLLQMGLHAEHNFIESIDTNTQYPYASTRQIRSFNSELINSDHFIFGKKFYDCFNSTIDYVDVANNKTLDLSSFVINDFYEINRETWVATDKNIFALSSDRLSVDREIKPYSSSDLDITSIAAIGDSVYVVGSDDIYVSDDWGISWTKNDGFGLPRDVYQINSVFNILVVGGSDGIYYTTKDSSTWTKANFYNTNAEVVVISKQVSSLVVPGMAYCLIDNVIYKSFNGINWKEVYSFDSLSITGLVVDRIFYYNNNMFALTNKGLYNDIGSLNNTVSNVFFELMEIDSTDSVISTKDLSYSGATILVLAEKNTLYKSIDSATTWTKQTISAVDFSDHCHIWNRIKITDAFISKMNTIGVPTAITNQLSVIKDIVYSNETSLRSALQGIYTTLEYNNYGDSIIIYSTGPYGDTELLSSLEDVYVRQDDLSFDYGFTVAMADRVYQDNLKQPIIVNSTFDKVSVYLSPIKFTGTDYSVTLTLYGADVLNNIISGPLSTDVKSVSQLYGNGWVNFRIYYGGGYERIVLVMTHNSGDNNNCVKWNYSTSSSCLGAINDSGEQTYTYNYILWRFEDAADTTNLRLSSDPADSLTNSPDIGTGDFYQTEYDGEKVNLSLGSRVLSFLVDQSGSQIWNDYYGSRFDLIRQFATDLNNIYPGNLYYALASYGSLIIDTLGIEIVEDSDDNILGGDYRIVRKTDTYPTTPIDGSIIANTSLTVANDDTVVNGQTYYYSIFNMRSDTIYSTPKNVSITVHNRSNPLPITGLTLEEVVVKETIGTPPAEVDTGKRQVVISFRTIQDYTSFYNAVRIVRKECYYDEELIDNSLSSAPLNDSSANVIEDDKIDNPYDGTVVYEGVINSGENIIIDDFIGTDEPNNGVKYYYAIYTKNAVGNYCLPQNALQSSIRISSVWRAWMYDPTYIVSQIPSEFLVSPSDVEDFTIEVGNTQNRISWTMPSLDTAIGVLIYADDNSTPDVDPLKVAHYDAVGSSSGISSDDDTSGTGNSFKPGKLIYQGTDSFFVHRELENNRKYYYRLYTFDRVRTISSGDTKGEAIPLATVTDDFEPPEAKNFYAEIFNDEKIILRWQRDNYYKINTNYFNDTVVVRSFAYDEVGSPIEEIDNFDFNVVNANFISKVPLEFDGGGDASVSVMTKSDYIVAVDKTSYDGEIRASFRLINAINPAIISQYLSADFTTNTEYKIYDAEVLSQEEEDTERTAAESFVDNTLFEEGLVDAESDNALEFKLESEQISFSLINPLTLSIANKYPSTQKVAQKETQTDVFGDSKEVVVYYDGVYARSGMSYYGDVSVSFEGESLDDNDVVNITAEVYELSHKIAQPGGGFKRVWKQTPSEIFSLESKIIELTSESDVDYAESSSINLGLNNIISKSIGTFRLLPPEQPAELNILVTAKINEYTGRAEHILLIKTMLNVDLDATAPIADGRDIAEQFVDVYVGPPKYDLQSKISRTPVPDGTLVKWELEKGRFGQDRPFYSSESVALQDGVYSVVRNGIARNVFFGPASDVKKHYVTTDDGVEEVGEEYTIKASSIYDGMFGSGEEEVEILPIDTTGSSYRFYMTNGYDMAGHVIYADGATSSTINIHADAVATGGDGGQTFYDCLDINDMPYIPLLEGQKIELQNPSFGNISEDESDIYYTYNGTQYTVAEDMPISILSGQSEFSVSVNAFVGPPPEKEPDPPTEPQFSACYFYGLVPVESDYPPVVSFSAQTKMIYGGQSIAMIGGGSRTKGIPPVILVLKEPLRIAFQKMMSRSNIVINPPNDGLNSTDVYFEASFSGNPLPDGSPITFEFVFYKDDDEELTTNQIDAMSEKDRRAFYAGFGSYEEFIAEINLDSYSGITSTVNGKSVVVCTLNPTRIKNNATVVLRATTTYDKLGTVEREMYADVSLKFVGTEEEDGGTSVYLKKVERYDPVGDDWTEIDSLNVGRVGSVCVYDSTTEKTFAIGGLTESGISVTGEVFEYARPDKSGVSGVFGTWSYIAEMTYGRVFAQSAIYNDKIYVLGGFGYNPFSGESGANSNVLCEVYDITANTWTVLSDMPHPVSHGTAEIIGSNIYVFSGIASMKESGSGHTFETFNNYLMKYNITTNTWTTIDELNSVNNSLMRISPVSYVKSGYIYVLNGIKTEFDPKSSDDAEFINTLIKIDVSDENNITYTDTSYINSPIQRFRAGAYALFGNKFYIVGGSGIKQYVDGSVTREFSGNTLRALEILDTTTNTWTTYRNLSKMTYERHSLGSTDDAEFFYAIGGAGSGYEPGKMFIEIDLDPNPMRADGRTQSSASISLKDSTGEFPEDGIKVLVRGYILIQIPLSGDSVSTSESSDAIITSGSVSDMANRVSIYPVLFSNLTLYTEDGACGTIILERSEDVLVALRDLVQYIDGDDTIIGIIYDEETKKVIVPKKETLEIKLGESRDLYQIIVEATIEDDYYYGRTNTEKTLGNNMSGYMQNGETGLLPGKIRDSETGQIIDDPDYEDFSDSKSLTSPEEQEQGESPTLEVYSDIVWIPYVNTSYDIMNFSQFTDELDLLEQAIPFGGSPHWDAIIDFSQNTLKKDEILSIEKFILDVSDNEENLSKNLLDDAIDQVHLIDGYQKVPVFTNSFVTSFPPSLSARKGQSNTVDLEKLSGNTFGLSHTILNDSYIDPIIKKIKIGSVGAMGRGTYTQIVDFGQQIYIISLKALFELYSYTNGWVEIYYSSDGYNYTSAGVIYEADVIENVNVSGRYIKFVITLSSEFGNASLSIPVPPPAFLGIEFTYSEPKTQYIFTYSYDIASYIREIYMTMNGTIPTTSDVQLGLTLSNSTSWDDYQRSAQPSVSENGRITVVNSTMNLVNLVSPSSGGKTPLTYKTYEEIMQEFKEEKQDIYGKVVDEVIIIEYKTATDDGSSKIVFSDSTSITIDEAPDFSNAIDFSTIEGSNPTKLSTSGTILNYDFIYSIDGYMFESKYGRWQPDSAVNVYRNGILVDPTEYVLLRENGFVKFFERQRLTGNYAIEVSLNPKYRIGLAVTNRDSTNYAILDEFAYIYNTNFVKTKDYNNSIPTVTDLYITPLSAMKNSTFTVNYTYIDGNNDIERNSEIQWYINGGIIPELKNKSSWSASDLIKDVLKDGDRIFFTVRPSDGKVFGSLIASQTTYIGDTPPTISGLGLIYIRDDVVSSTPNSDANIIVQYTYSDSQGRAESGTSIEWFINGVALVYDVDEPTILLNGTTDSNDELVIAVGNVIKARIIPSNGIIEGEVYETEEITILNSAPSLLGVSLTPAAPSSNSVITVSYTYVDRDDDEDQTEIRWYKNGELISALNDSKQVNASFLTTGDSWYADLTPYDGEDRGIVVRISTLTIS